MEQNRNRDEDMPNRSSNMEPAEGSRETVRNSGSDLGTSSDRAMFDESMSEAGEQADRGSEQGRGESGERNSGSNSGGITNRELSREQSEQEQLPPRGQSSER